MGRARPTLRCLREDVKLALGSADQPIDEIDHPLLTKTNEQFADPATAHARIVAIDDQLLFKVKIQRWRGAVWLDGPNVDAGVWLVAAGWREDGAVADFYAALTTDAKVARSRYNATHSRATAAKTYTAHHSKRLSRPGPT